MRRRDLARHHRRWTDAPPFKASVPLMLIASIAARPNMGAIASVGRDQAYLRVSHLSDAALSNDEEDRNSLPRTAKNGKAPSH